MITRMSIKVMCVVLLPAVTSGCGFVFTHAPPDRHYEMDYFACTENNAGPIIDLVWAGLNGLATLVSERRKGAGSLDRN